MIKKTSSTKSQRTWFKIFLLFLLFSLIIFFIVFFFHLKKTVSPNPASSSFFPAKQTLTRITFQEETLADQSAWKTFTEEKAFHLSFRYPAAWGEPQRVYSPTAHFPYQLSFRAAAGDQEKIRFHLLGVDADFVLSEETSFLEEALKEWDFSQTDAEKSLRLCKIFNGQNCHPVKERIFALTATPQSDCQKMSSFQNLIFVEMPNEPVRLLVFEIPLLSSAALTQINTRFPLLDPKTICQEEATFNCTDFNQAVDAALVEINAGGVDAESDYYQALFPKIIESLQVSFLH